MSVTKTPPLIDPYQMSAYFNYKVQDAIDYCANTGGGTVLLPPYRYPDTKLTLHSGVGLAGLKEGPFDNYNDPMSGPCIGATFLVENSDTNFLTLSDRSCVARDLVFYYPDQVPWSSSQPKPYPSTVLVAQGASDCRVERLYGINPFVFIECQVGRTYIEEIHSGAIQAGLIIDHCEDYTFLTNFMQTTSYNNWPPGGTSQTSPLDEYTIANRYGIMLNRVDALRASNIGLWWNYCGVYMGDSSDTTLPFSRAGYGQFTNLDVDTCQYALIAKSTDVVGGGFTFMNCNIGAAQPPLAKSAVITIPGGAQEPLVTWIGGAVRGVWAGGIVDQMAGSIIVKDVRGYDLPLS
jgi:hypothetical protein